MSFAVEGVEKGHYKIGILRQQGEQTGVLFKTDRSTVKEAGNNKIKVNW